MNHKSTLDGIKLFLPHDCTLSPPLDSGIAPPPEPDDRFYNKYNKINYNYTI